MPSWGYDTTMYWQNIYFVGSIVLSVISVLAIIGLTTIWYVAFHRKGKYGKKSGRVFVVLSVGLFCWAALVGLSAIILYPWGDGILHFLLVINSGYVMFILGFGFLAPLVFSVRYAWH